MNYSAQRHVYPDLYLCLIPNCLFLLLLFWFVILRGLHDMQWNSKFIVVFIISNDKPPLKSRELGFAYPHIFVRKERIFFKILTYLHVISFKISHFKSLKHWQLLKIVYVFCQNNFAKHILQLHNSCLKHYDMFQFPKVPKVLVMSYIALIICAAIIVVKYCPCNVAK